MNYDQSDFSDWAFEVVLKEAFSPATNEENQSATKIQLLTAKEVG